MLTVAPQPAPFIVGVARSGTTLLRLMLDAHPEMAIPPETYILLPFLRQGRSSSEVDVDEFCSTVTGFQTWPDFGIDAAGLAREASAIQPFSLREGARLVYRMYAIRHGKKRWGDKTPSYRSWMPQITQLLPESRMIHIIRDGRDVALSLREQWFTPAKDMAGLALHWRDEVTATRAAGAELPHYSEVRFEDLVVNPRRILMEMCGNLTLPFDAGMELYHLRATDRLGEIADQHLPDGRTITREVRLAKHKLASSPPEASRIGVWRKAMTAAERQSFTAVAGDLLRELGYD